MTLWEKAIYAIIVQEEMSLAGWLTDCTQNEINKLAERAGSKNLSIIADCIVKGDIDYEDII